MITKIRISLSDASEEFGMACQRLIPWQGAAEGGEPPVGAMACFLPSGSSSEPDCHNQDEVMIVLSGTGRLDLAQETTDFQAGDLLVLPRNQEHVVHNPTGSLLSWVSVYWPLHEPAPEVSA
ncbi:MULTISPECIES: cupin domain-containing protein [Streptomyces]|uniref:Cupin domain-containing protein n=1 Tax=Streptomyces desertarenae TaxID=2666184 RepID=A0ABW4PLS6_9ACTN